MVSAGMICTVFLREHLGQWLLIVAIADDGDGEFLPVVLETFATREHAVAAIATRQLISKAFAMELPELEAGAADAARYIMEFPDEALAESVALVMEGRGEGSQH